LTSAKEAGITAKKQLDFGEWYTQVVTKTGLADYAPVKGFIVLRPYGYAIWEEIRSILDKKFKQTGHQNGFLPVLIPENLLMCEKEHFEGFNPEVFWVTEAGGTQLSEKLALRPTSETLAYSMFSKWITSYRELPMKINYWNSALRAEIKATKPFVRTSEFLWQEGHTVHALEEEAEHEVMSILKIYSELMENYLAIPILKGFKSEKEKFVGAKYTTTLEGLMADGKALQLGTSHNLGQNFSKPFDIKYLGRDSKEHFAWQTSWGVSWRLIGAVIMTHGDDKGLILPPGVAPVQVVIVPIFRGENAKFLVSKAKEVAQELEKLNLRVHVDDRDEYTAGWKFNDWELKGVPLRVNLGPREVEMDQVELVRRDTLEKSLIRRSKLTDSVLSVLEEIQSNLLLRAKRQLEDNLVKTTDYTTLKDILRTKGGFILTGWCGDQECEVRIKEETAADIRLLPFQGQEMSKSSVCIYCKRQSKKIAVFAKAY
jgi:prolyl-tRNA synthetase